LPKNYPLLQRKALDGFNEASAARSCSIVTDRKLVERLKGIDGINRKQGPLSISK
jgi:hypothetical protein